MPFLRFNFCPKAVYKQLSAGLVYAKGSFLFFKQKLVCTFASMFIGADRILDRKISIIILIFSIFGVTLTYGQSNNPFEIKSRLKEEPVELKEEPVTEEAVDNSNPFDIVRNEKPGSKPDAGIVAPTPEIKKETVSPTSISEEEKKSFLFLAIISMLVYLAVVITMIREYIWKAWKAFTNDNMLTQFHREQGVLPQIPYLLLYSLFFINAGIFAWLILDHYDSLPFNGTWVNLYATTGIILAIIIFKHILLRITGVLFPISKELSIYSFTIMIFNIIIGLGLAFVNFLLAFFSEGLFAPVFWAAIGLIGATLLFRQLRGLFIGGKYVAMHKFHFLLYLCVIEIAPVAVYLKLILTAQ